MVDHANGFQKSHFANSMRELTFIGITAAVALKEEVKRKIIKKEGAKHREDKLLEKLAKEFSFRGVVCGLHKNIPKIFVIKTYGQKFEEKVPFAALSGGRICASDFLENHDKKLADTPPRERDLKKLNKYAAMYVMEGAISAGMVDQPNSGGQIDLTILSKEARCDHNGDTVYDFEVNNHIIQVENDGNEKLTKKQLLASYVPPSWSSSTKSEEDQQFRTMI